MSLLLRHLEANGPLSRADLEAATRRQQQAGGSLDTAILELGLMTPVQLDHLLQSACGLPGAPVRLLERGPARPWEHVPRDLVDIGWAMPLVQEDGRLIVAVHPDLPDAKLGQLYRMVRGFYPVVAPECCLAKIAAERTGSILAPRYALILLDYLEAMRTSSLTISLVPTHGPASELTSAHVLEDRQAERGDAAAAKPAGVESPGSSVRSVADAPTAGEPVPADSSTGAGAATPDLSTSDERPVSSDMAEDEVAPGEIGGSDDASATDESANASGARDAHEATAPVLADSPADASAQSPVLADSPAEASPEAPVLADSPADASPEAPVLADNPADTSAGATPELRAADAPVPADRPRDAADARALGATQDAAAPLTEARGTDVPVPADRQNAGPRPAAMSGPTTAARASGLAGSPATSGSATAASPRPADAGSLRGAGNGATARDESLAPVPEDISVDSSRPAAEGSTARVDLPQPVPATSPSAAGEPSGSAPASPDRSSDLAAAVPEDRPAATIPDARPANKGEPSALTEAFAADAARASRHAQQPGLEDSLTDDPAPTPAASRQTAAYDSAPETDSASITANPAPQPSPTRPSSFDPVPVAPDAPLVPPRGFDDGGGSFAGMAIAPDTPLIILPPAPTTRPTPRARDSSGLADRRTLVGIPVGAATTPPDNLAPGANDSATRPSEAAPPVSSTSSPAPASSASPVSSTSSTALEEAPPVASASSPAPAGSALPVSSARSNEPADAAPVPSTSASEAAVVGADEALIESSTKKPPALPQAMVMTLAQRLDAARAALATARERDRITEALVKAASLVAPRVALFGVKREGLRVLAAPGSALRLSEGLVIPLPEGGLLDRAVSGQGPLHLLIEPSLSFAVGQPLGIPCIFEPVLAGGRTVLMLYVDRAGVAFDPRERTVLRELCDTARQSLEALLRLLGWVVPGGTVGAGAADRARPSVRPHPIVSEDEADAPAAVPPVPEDIPEPEPEPAVAAAAPETPDEPPPSPARLTDEPGFGDSSSAASRSRGRSSGSSSSSSSSRGRGIITLKNPIRRDDPSTVTPLPVRAESSAVVRAQPSADEPEPSADEQDYEDLTDDHEADSPPPRRDGPGLGLAPVPVPLGPENGPDSPLVARFAAMFTRPPVPTVTIDLTDRPGTFGHGRSDTSGPPAAARADMPGWIATAEPSGIEDPLPVASALRSAADARVDHDPASTLPGAPRVMLDETARGGLPDPEFDDWPRAASDTPTILDLSPPLTHAPLLVESLAAPDAKTVLDIPPLVEPGASGPLIPNLVAPPGTPGAVRRRRPAEPSAEEPVLVIPKTLRRSSGLTATPHPMARRSGPDELEGGPTLSMPTTLIGPRSGRRRAKHEPRPEASSDVLTMPRLVREADDVPAASSSTSGHVPEDMSSETGPEGHVAEDTPRDDATEAAATASAAAAPPTDAAPADRPAEAGPTTALDEREIDAVLEAFLQNPAEWTSVSRLRALDERGLARLAARFPGPIDLANATTFPPPSAHGPLLRACVELGHAVSPHVLALFASVRPQIRFYAAFLFQELRDPRCLRPLAELAFDPDPDVRLIATRVLESYSRVPDFAAVAAEIRGDLESEDHDRQLLAVEAAGTLRDTLAVPRLIDLLAVRDKHVREAALEALCSITAKHHGYRAQRWRAWYAEHGQEPRIEWVIDGLRHRDEAVRRWAADELARITGQRIPFPAEGDRRSRDLALRAWQAWWDSNREDFTTGP
ncbi:hypothetical protein [Nannocystis bainbridge]|uniref:Type II secretion system protein GspE N-terminal domain-containing protein n=1 Tax=Nannocystis bainbridge TaxID=2995303 RepID=A0ABT5E2U8_9BACT|nr:hypothetical protein [Nannocystis bainbridge]MDC0719283.1 hypothetical protein [Nannocystis bainbridge]